MVYSRATTSAMAERPPVFPAGREALGALGGIVQVAKCYQRRLCMGGDVTYRARMRWVLVNACWLIVLRGIFVCGPRFEVLVCGSLT